MALPTLVKTHAFDVNVAVAAQGASLATNRRVLRSIKNSIVGLSAGAIYSVRYSCNGTTAGTAGDGVDRWASDSDLVSANAGVAHSWIVLRSVLGWELLISCENSSATLAVVSMWTSYAAHFTGGSTTARPTAADEVPISVSTNWGGQNDLAHRYHVRATTDGSQLWVGVCQGGAMVYTWDIVAPTIPAGVTWDLPLVARIANGSANLYIDAVLFANSNWIGRRGATTLALRNTTEGAATAGSVPSFYSVIDPWTGGWPMVGLGFMSTTVGQVSRGAGVWPDVYSSVPTAVIPTGDTLPEPPATPLFQWAKFGNLWMPWNGTNPLLS